MIPDSGLIVAIAFIIWGIYGYQKRKEVYSKHKREIDDITDYNFKYSEYIANEVYSLTSENHKKYKYGKDGILFGVIGAIIIIVYIIQNAS